MLRRVEQYIRTHKLLSKDRLSLVALSGGADSVCLLLLLKQLGYWVEAVHCNFHLRGEESDRDELFVKNLCEKQGVKLHLIHFDTKTYAELHHVSIEMAARQLRYRYFDQLITDIGAEGVCVAHHQDDAIETLLINLLRGTGIHGLTGIRPRNGHVLRPLLCVSRAEIIGYLADIGQDYVTDSTNLVPDVMRNKIRLQLLPLMEDICPATRANLLTTAHNMAEAEKVYDYAIRESEKFIVKSEEFAAAIPSADSTAAANSSLFTMNSSLLSQLPSASCFLHEWLSPLGFTSAQTQQIARCLDGQPGKTFASATHELLIDRETVIVQPIEPPARPLVVPETGFYRMAHPNEIPTDAPTRSLSLRVELRAGTHIIKEYNSAGLDAATVKFPLILRPVQTGDRFQPFGMKGSRLVSDYLTDQKLSLFDKRRQLVVADASGRIVWVVGRRTAHFCRVTPDSCQTLVLQINFPPTSHPSSLTPEP